MYKVALNKLGVSYEHCSGYSVLQLIPVTKLRMRIWKFPPYNISCIEIQEIIRKQK